MSTILVTGATGQVGQTLVPLLQQGGHRVLYLIRPSDGKDATARLREIVSKVRKNDIAIGGDVTLPFAGMSGADRRKWKGQIDKIIHGAASIKFDEAVAQETWHINVEGTRHMLALAKELGVEEFHFLSTAYVAGDARVLYEDDFDVNQTGRNAYEDSKLEAERLIRSWSAGKFSVYRLGIVIGDSATGYSQSFNGYYGFFVGFWRLLQSLRQRWKASETDCRAQGIVFDDDGFLELPLSIDCSPESRLNLVTTDWLSKTLIRLFDLPASNQTFHLTHPIPPRVQWVIEVSLEHLGIRGVVFREEVDFSTLPMLERFQRGLEKNLKRYRPYVTQEPVFDCENLTRTLIASVGHHVPPPAIDQRLLIKMLDYAMSVNFGQTVRQPVHSGD